MTESMKLADEFNRYFTSSNGVDVSERITVSRDEWRALLAAMKADAPMESFLCESRRVVLRIGRVYRFHPDAECATCQQMKKEHDTAYLISGGTQ